MFEVPTYYEERHRPGTLFVNKDPVLDHHDWYLTINDNIFITVYQGRPVIYDFETHVLVNTSVWSRVLLPDEAL